MTIVHFPRPKDNKTHINRVMCKDVNIDTDRDRDH